MNSSPNILFITDKIIDYSKDSEPKYIFSPYLVTNTWIFNGTTSFWGYSFVTRNHGPWLMQMLGLNTKLNDTKCSLVGQNIENVDRLFAYLLSFALLIGWANAFHTRNFKL